MAWRVNFVWPKLLTLVTTPMTPVRRMVSGFRLEPRSLANMTVPSSEMGRCSDQRGHEHIVKGLRVTGSRCSLPLLEIGKRIREKKKESD